MGNFTLVADSTAADGVLLNSINKGWSTTTPLASPSHFVEFSFAASPNTPYHVWVRMRAGGNSAANDSAYAQFSDAVTASGGPLFGIGTASALTLNLQTAKNAKLNGWGWVDGAYWLSQASTLSFSGSGMHTLRIQTREDGEQLDQVVLSPATYLTSSPGQASGDSTIIARPPAMIAASAIPFSGTPIPLPGTFQAEDFDYGDDGSAYHDTDGINEGGAYRTGGVDLEASSEGQYDIGWIKAGEWLNYTVNVAAPGAYLLEARVAAPTQGGTFHVEFGGINVTGALAIPATGSWQTWTTVSAMVTLQAGVQSARVVFDASGPSALGNLNWIRVSAAVATPAGATAAALPGTIAVERYDSGGEGLAYHDTTAGNAGAAYRTDDVDLETSSLGTADIGWISSGEWVRYAVDVATAGSYTISIQVASPNTGGSMHVSLGSVTTAPATVPNTGGYQNWQTISWTAALNAGPQTLALIFDSGGFNVTGLSVTAATVTESAPPPPLPPPSAPPASGTTWSVSTGADLQAAINAAAPGDVILLQAGTTFTGNFTLPAKSGSGYVTIRTNIADPVPAGTRITPATAVNLAKIVSGNRYTAMATQPYAHHYVLQLLEFQANTGGYGEVLSLGDGSAAQNSLDMVPHDIIVDRIYLHGDATSGQKRGIGLNSASTTIRDSFISDIFFVLQDSQAIGGWNGPGPYTITNNYLEAASENFLLGGSDPSITDLIPSDITFTKNYLSKPLAWMSRTDLNVKNLFELKNAQRLTIDGNIFENNWYASQKGYAIMLTGRSQSGTAPWSVVQDFTFTNNIVRNVSSGINILGQDYYYPSGVSHHFVFRNNLFQLSMAANGGYGRLLLINGGYDVTVDHNTILTDGASVIFGDTNPVPQFAATNNIAPDNGSAIVAGGLAAGTVSIAAYFPNSLWLDGVWAGASTSTYPTGNYYPANLGAVGFVNLSGGDYHLAAGSVYKGAASDGTDVGANIDQILAATAGVTIR